MGAIWLGSRGLSTHEPEESDLLFTCYVHDDLPWFTLLHNKSVVKVNRAMLARSFVAVATYFTLASAAGGLCIKFNKSVILPRAHRFWLFLMFNKFCLLSASKLLFKRQIPRNVYTSQQRWADRYFGPLVRCPADYRNVSGPADWKK